MLVGVLSSDAPRDETTGGVSDTSGNVSNTPLALRFADVGAARAWILAASGLIRAYRFSFVFLQRQLLHEYVLLVVLNSLCSSIPCLEVKEK